MAFERHEEMFNFTHHERNTNCNNAKMASSPTRLAQIQNLEHTLYGRGHGKVVFSYVVGGNQNGKDFWDDLTIPNKARYVFNPCLSNPISRTLS